jgi:CRP-like cAMP-binding protein
VRHTKQTKNPHVDALLRWPGLGGCTDTELEDLARLVDEVTFHRGDVLMRQGEHGAEAFMILEGAVEISIDGRVVNTVGPEHFVGEMALLEHDVRTATATAVKETRTLVLSRRAFQAVVSQPYVASRLATELAHRVRTLQTDPR